MAPQNGGSVGELSRESQVTRDAFVHTIGELKNEVADTIDDLKARLSPSHIKTEFNGYVREEGGQLLSTIERKARDNPLQAVAIGAGLIYPAWGIIKTIPIPILLIGGGVWLSRQRSGGVPTGVSDAAKEVASSAQEMKTSIAAQAEAVSETVSGRAHEIVDSAKAAVETAASAVKAETTDAIEAILAGAVELGQEGARALNQSRTVVEEMIDRNPLLIGGIAIAIGAFVAASLPRSQVEDNLFGERSNEVMGKAREAVSQGIEQAKDAAADVVGDFSAAAAREGLNSEALSKSLEGAGETVKAVLKKGVTTALGGADANSQTVD